MILQSAFQWSISKGGLRGGIHSPLTSKISHRQLSKGRLTCEGQSPLVKVQKKLLTGVIPFVIYLFNVC